MPNRSSTSAAIFFPSFSQEDVIQRLRERAPALREELPVDRVVLFGSYATGRHTVASDIDVLVVYRGRPRPDAFALVKCTYELPRLEPQVYSKSEAEAVADVIDRMERDGIRIYPDLGAKNSLSTRQI